MAALSDPRVILSGLAVVSAAYAVAGVVVFAVGVYRANPHYRTIGRYLAITSPLPVVLVGVLVAAVAVAPPVVQLALWVVVVVGAWGPILLSPAIAVAFIVYR